jgi:hypothetical protein
MEKRSFILLTLIMALYCFMIMSGVDLIFGKAKQKAVDRKKPAWYCLDRDLIIEPKKPFFSRTLTAGNEGIFWDRGVLVNRTGYSE